MKPCHFFLLFLFLFGCRSNENPIVFVDEIERIDEAGFKELVTERNGKILFVNVWATWCVPCREEFPDIIKLRKKFAKRNIEFFGISADYPDEVDSKVKPFLKKFNLNFKTYVQNFENDETFINSLSTDWNGALPATFIFDSKGSQKVFLQGKKSFEEFEKNINSIIN